MAKIHPPILEPTTQSPAERRLYEAFARELDDEWVVFHHVKWIGHDDLGRPRDGEADFVVAHPHLGILVVEVKGGRIRFDETTGHYISTDHDNVEHDVGDPFEQATASKHTLIARLRAARGWPQRRIVFGHAVAFPDAVVEASWLRPNAPREIIVDALDLVSLEGRLRGALVFWHGQSATDAPPGRAGIEVLVRTLAQSDRIRNPPLDSRHALRKLPEVLLSSAPRGDCLAALCDALLAQEPVQVRAHPGSLGDRLDPTLGLGVVTEVDDAGQVQGASAVVVEPGNARDFVADGRWEERWGGPEHKPYETPGGVRVRSKSEYVIATKLEAAGIRFEYEPRLAYTDDDGRTRFIHPDFYLYEHNLYVEYWGRSDPDYVESRRFREQVYERLAAQRGIRVLHLEAGDIENDVFVGKVQEAMES